MLLVQTKSISGLALSSKFKTIAILSCAVLSIVIYDNGSNLLSPSTNIVHDKSKKAEILHNQQSELLVNPSSVDSTLTSIKDNASVQEKASTALLRSNSVRTASVLEGNGLDNNAYNYDNASHESSILGSSIKNDKEISSDINQVSSTTKNIEVKGAIDQTLPKIIWLMSFPASGTTFTFGMIHKYSNMTIAKNNGHDRDNTLDEKGYSIPVHPKFNNGPFIERKEKVTNYVLTKTHCEHQDLAQNYYAFRKQCSSGSRRFPETDKDKIPMKHSCKRGYCGESVTYDSDIVKKVMHLIRDPFTNIVSRFNREQRVNATYLKELQSNMHSYHDAFKSWCEEKDKNASNSVQSYYGKSFPSNVPCRHEFFRYIDWHNKAFMMTEELSVPTLVFHYENYKKNYSGALQQLGSFLENDIEKHDTNFRPQSYSFMYSEKERLAIKQWLEEISSASTWSSIKRYFGIDVWPKIIWLMSFPASGTTFTLETVKSVSNKTVAKNSAEFNNRRDELGYSVPPHESYKSGPFLEDKKMDIPEKYVFTKTHCEFRIDSSLYSYRNECVRGWSRYPQNDPTKSRIECMANGSCKGETHYDPSIVDKAVHLVRNPLENIIARFNNSHKGNKSLVNFTHSHPKEYIKLFHNWCYEQDRKASVKNFYDSVPNIPCASEVFRYVQWHNHAILLTNEMNISTMILYYENYASDLNNTVTRLFSFLEYEMVGRLPSFNQHNYSFMYTNEERERIRDWIKVLASKSVWDMLEHYFY